jgi:hypothetical protein
MTPADITDNENFIIYQGAKWDHTVTFTQTDGGDPVDLSGRTFSIAIAHPTKNLQLATGAASFVTDGTDGQLAIGFTAAQTDKLALGTVRIGLRDDLNNAYIVGTLPVEYFPLNPA